MTGWSPSPALRRAIAVTAAALLLAVVFGQPALVLVATPFAVGTAMSLVRRPTQSPDPRLTLDQPTTVESGPVRARVRVDYAHPDTALCVVSVATPEWVRLRHGEGDFAALLRPTDSPVVRVDGTALRWGHHVVGPAVVRVYACDGLLTTDRQVLSATPLSVYPASEVFDSDEPLPRATGIAGIHRSRRPGPGGELAEVRPFQAGDRLRRINWRVSQRTGDLHVNSTHSDRDADVVIVLDVRYEAGRSGGVTGRESVLDATVRAAAAITGHYTHQGDRVALLELGSRLRRLRAGTGRRHHLAALEWLAGVNAMPGGFLPGDRLFTSGLQPMQALVIVLTPLLDRASAAMLAVVARTGRPLVAVDTLPEGVRVPADGPWSSAAERLWWLERTNTLGRLQELGVPVEAWRGPGSLDAMLRHVYQLAAKGVLAR